MEYTSEFPCCLSWHYWTERDGDFEQKSTVDLTHFEKNNSIVVEADLFDGLKWKINLPEFFNKDLIDKFVHGMQKNLYKKWLDTVLYGEMED